MRRLARTGLAILVFLALTAGGAVAGPNGRGNNDPPPAPPNNPGVNKGALQAGPAVTGYIPPMAIQSQPTTGSNRPAPNRVNAADPSPEAAMTPAGPYRSTRPTNARTEALIPGATGPQESPAADAPAGLPTLNEARENVPGLLASYAVLKAKGGFLRLEDPGTGKALAARYDGVDQSSVRQLGPGLFTAAVRLHDAAGRRVDAQADIDLRGDEWKVTRLVRGETAKKIDGAACFNAAVKKRVRKDSRRGVFSIHDELLNKDWRLIFKTAHAERVESFGSGGFYACVDFLEKGGDHALDLDFYVGASGGRCEVEQIVIHLIDGKPRTIKPKSVGVH